MRQTLAIVVGLALVLGLWAVPAPTATAVTTPCVGRPFQPTGTTTVHTTHRGRPRSYVLHVPSGYFPTNRTPVVYNFHGAGWTGPEQLEYSEYLPFADAHGIIVVAPNADPSLGYWAPWSTRVDDVGFVREIINELQDTLCVDNDRVFATGMSSGGIMSGYLACRLSNRIASVVTVAGTIQPNHCRTSRPVPVMAFHGNRDQVIRYHGGGTIFGVPVPPVKSELRIWALRNGCADRSTVVRLHPDVVERRWRCTGNRMVKLVKIEGGGHTWPGASRDIPSLGHTTQSVSATVKGWSFLENHPRA